MGKGEPQQVDYTRAIAQTGLRDRPVQRQMIQSIRDALARKAGERVAVVEAATGVGKAMAYLIATFEAARDEGKTLLITTASVQLQTQLLEHEIPRLEKIVGKPIRAVVAKGMGRRVCDYALEKAAGRDPAQQELELGAPGAAPVWRKAPTNDERNQAEAMLLARQAGWDGDLDTYDATVEPEVKASVTLGRTACVGKLCPHLTRCAIRRARAQVTTAEVVVTNHDLLLTDLAISGGGALLPAPGDSVIVVDEAHRLAEKAIERFAAHIRIGVVRKTVKRIEGVVAEACAALGVERTQATTIAAVKFALEELDRFGESIEREGTSISNMHGAGENSVKRWRVKEHPGIVAAATVARRHAQVVCDFIENKRDQVREATALPRPVVTGLLEQMGSLANILHEWCNWAKTTHDASVRDPAREPIALWSEVRGADVILHAAPTDVAGHLRSWLIERAHAIVFTSATLRTLGTFDYFARRTGLRQVPDAAFTALPSPYDLDVSARLIVPAEACDPREEDRHTAMVARWVEQHHCAKAGTLVLFTSRRQLLATKALLSDDVAKKVLVSGQNQDTLLKKHRRRVARGDASILFGLEGFSEGLDLPGKECEVLIIARLPFSPPDGPIAQTRSEWLQERGRSYFAEESVPEAHHRLVQRMGRLIRSETDTGTIYVLDNRIVTTRYGRRMWETLPPYAKEDQTRQRPAA